MMPDSWSATFREVGVASDTATILTSDLDPGRAVALLPEQVMKAVDTDRELTSYMRRNSLNDEYELLATLRDIDCVPDVLWLKSLGSVDILAMHRVNGRPATKDQVKGLLGLRLLIQAAICLARLSRKGVAHNDVTWENILISGSELTGIVDFDQAEICPTSRAVARNFLGIGATAYASWIHLAAAWLAESAPRIFAVYSRLRDLRRRFRAPAPKAEECTTQRTLKLREAWVLAASSNASSPGQNIAYYSHEVDGVYFPGERPWLLRWEMLSSTTQFQGKRVLEMGCNMGLLATFLMAEAGAESVIAVDHDSKILDAANLVASAYGVEVDFKQIDFDDPRPWEDQFLHRSIDIVCVLNVLNWVADPDRLLRFIGGFPEVLYEGHDSVATETARLQSVGFSDARLVAVSDRGRPVIHGTR